MKTKTIPTYYYIKYPITRISKRSNETILDQFHIQKFKDKNTALLLCDILRELGVKFHTHVKVGTELAKLNLFSNTLSGRCGKGTNELPR